jgi:hypothetical protein
MVQALGHAKQPAPSAIIRIKRTDRVERRQDITLPRAFLHVRELVDAAALPRDAFNALRLVEADDVDLRTVRHVDNPVAFGRALRMRSRQRQRLQVIPKYLLRLVVRRRRGEILPGSAISLLHQEALEPLGLA